jgi:hypothetical protein
MKTQVTFAAVAALALAATASANASTVIYYLGQTSKGVGCESTNKNGACAKSSIDSKLSTSGTVTYSSSQIIEFKFTVDSPYNFSFNAVQDVNYTPAFSITETATGGAGMYTETFTPVKIGNSSYSGTIAYTLTAAVPEPASWALMIVGVGAVGASMRRKSISVAV